MSCETFRCRCRCKCYETCRPRCEYECRPSYECKPGCEYPRRCECEPRHECDWEHNRDQGKNCEWFEKVLKDFYWRGFNDGCKKCGRKETDCDGYGYDACEK